MSPVLGSRSQVFTTSTSAGGGGGSSPGGTAPGPVLGGRSQVFRVEADGGGGGASPGGTAPGPVLGGRAQVFMVLPSGEIAMVTCSCCGITDTFSRGDGPQEWGFADAHDLDSGSGEWAITDANVGTTMGWEATVEGTYGRLWAEGGAGNPAAPTARLYGIGVWQTFRLTFRVKFVTFDTVTETVYVNFNVVSSAGASQVNFTLGDGIYLSSNGVGGTTRVDFDPTPGTWYRVRFEQDEDDELRVRVWEDGDTEPGTWTLVKDVSAQTDWSGPTEFRIDAAQVDSGDPGTSDLEVHVDDLDIEEVGSCVFDNFNREVTDGWGDTTPTNYPWSTSDPYYDPFLSVSGGVGVLAADSSSATTFVMVTGLSESVPLDVRLKCRFVQQSAIPDFAAPEVDFYVGGTDYLSGGDFLGAFLYEQGTTETVPDDDLHVRTAYNAGGFTLGSEVSAVTGGYIDEWLNVRLSFEATAIRVKVWKVGDVEPADWTTETTSPSFPGPIERFVIQIQGTMEDSITFEFDNIIFDTGCVLDDYNRTVAPDDQPDLGVTEQGSYTYTWFGGGTSGMVSIENGYLRFTGPAVGEGFFQKHVVVGDGYLITELGSHTQFGIRFRTSLIMANQPNDATRFRVDVQGSDGAYELDFLFDSVVGYARLNDGGGQVTALDAPEPNRIEKDDWVADSWYIAKCVVDGADIRVRLWREDDGEPLDYQLADDVGFPWTVAEGQIGITVDFDTGTAPVGPFYDHTVDLDYLKISNLCEA